VEPSHGGPVLAVDPRRLGSSWRALDEARFSRGGGSRFRRLAHGDSLQAPARPLQPDLPLVLSEGAQPLRDQASLYGGIGPPRDDRTLRSDRHSRQRHDRGRLHSAAGGDHRHEVAGSSDGCPAIERPCGCWCGGQDFREGENRKRRSDWRERRGPARSPCGVTAVGIPARTVPENRQPLSAAETDWPRERMPGNWAARSYS